MEYVKSTILLDAFAAILGTEQEIIPHQLESLLSSG